MLRRVDPGAVVLHGDHEHEQGTVAGRQARRRPSGRLDIADVAPGPFRARERLEPVELVEAQAGHDPMAAVEASVVRVDAHRAISGCAQARGDGFEGPYRQLVIGVEAVEADGVRRAACENLKLRARRTCAPGRGRHQAVLNPGGLEAVETAQQVARHVRMDPPGVEEGLRLHQHNIRRPPAGGRQRRVVGGARPDDRPAGAGRNAMDELHGERAKRRGIQKRIAHRPEARHQPGGGGQSDGRDRRDEAELADCGRRRQQDGQGPQRRFDEEQGGEGKRCCERAGDDFSRPHEGQVKVRVPHQLDEFG